MLRIKTLGGLSIRLEGEPVTGFVSRKAKALLVYLAATGRPHSREILADLLWDDRSQQRAMSNLRVVLSSLRKQVGNFVTITRDTVTINLESDFWIDAVELDACLGFLRKEPVISSADTASKIAETLALYDGDFLKGFHVRHARGFEEWLIPERERLHKQVLEGLHELVGFHLRQARYPEGIQFARRLLQMELFEELAHQQMMRLLAHSGRRREALDQYENCRQILDEELGAVPSPETEELVEAIRSGEFDSTKPRSGEIRGYRILEKIGSGSFGVVYKAYQPSVGREVVVKAILPQYANDPEFIRRFEAEAHTVARLEHPRIVPLYDFWREPGGAYLVMRWLRGGNLKESLAEGAWKLNAAVRLVDQIASALAAAHDRDVVHRDLKPANILLDEKGEAYLSDFGIAKDLTGGGQITKTGAVLGSLSYISPEQVLSENITSRTDIYSLGVVIYEILTGELPFTGASQATLVYKHVHEPLPSVITIRPDIPEALDNVIQKATAKKPEDRFGDAQSLALAFREAVGGDSPSDHIVGAEATLAGLAFPNPYKGLRAFQEADAAVFFGRQTLIQNLLLRLIPPQEQQSITDSQGRFLAVVGPSGSGKSSVVKAGLIPNLRQGAVPGSDNWFIVEMVPGIHPFEELEAALLRIAVNPPATLLSQLREDERGLVRAIKRVLPGDEDSNLLLAIDQFEELFTLCDDQNIGRLFLESLYTAVTEPRSRINVIITLRADFYDRPLMHPDFSQLVRRYTEVVTPMNVEELTQAIRRPAELVGVNLEEEVLTAVITDVHEQPGGLPLMQYALTELFEQRANGLLTLEGYTEIGGVMGALGRRAEELFTSLDEIGQETVRQLFLRLVTLGEGVEDTRRRVLRLELEGLADSNEFHPNTTESLEDKSRMLVSLTGTTMTSVIDTYGRFRLLTFDHDPATREPTVEIAHEALLREWKRLAQWLDESRGDVRMQRLLDQAAVEWRRAARDAGFLLRGARLDQFAGWAETSSLVLNKDEQTFLRLSVKARESRQTEEDARQQRELVTAQKLAQTEKARAEEQAGSAQRLRRLAIILAGALVIALGLAIAAAIFSGQSRQNANLAATRGGEAQVESDVRATAEAVAVQERMTAEEQTRLAFSRELAAAALNSLVEDQERAVLLAIQALDQAHTQEAEDALHRTAQELRLLQTLEALGKSPFVALSPDGRQLITSGSLGATVWDAATGEIIYELNTGHYINRAAFSPDGTLLVLPYENTSEQNPEGYLEPSAISILDARTGEGLLSFVAHDAWVQDVSFSSDGALFASASGDGTTKVWDMEDTLAAGEGQERMTLTTGETFPWLVHFSPDGTRLATANDDGTLRIWETTTGQELLRLNAESYAFAFSPNGTRLVTGSYAGMLGVYDANSGEQLSSILAHDNMVMSVMFSRDGTRMASTGDDSTVKVWDYSEGILSPLLTLAGHKSKTTAVEFSPDGEQLFSGSSEADGRDMMVRIWDISPDGSLEPVFYPHEETVNGLAFNPNGTRLVTAGADGSAIIWDAASGQALHTLSGHDWIWRVSYSPDGTLLATAGRDAKVKLWDAVSGREIFSLNDHTIPNDSEYFRGVLGMAFSPDGEELATAGGDGRVRIWAVDAMRSGDLVLGDELFSMEDLPERQFGQVSMDVSFSPDGSWIAASINNWADLLGSYGKGSIKVWDSSTGQLIWTLGSEAGKTYMSVTFSPSGNRLAAGTIQRQATVWQLPDDATETPVELSIIQAGGAFVLKTSFNLDGTQLAVPHMDGMGIWDVRTGELLRTFPHPGSVMEAAYSPDGKRLATAGFDGFGRLFILDVEELIALAKSRLTRSLTDEECQQFLHRDSCLSE